MDAVIDGRRGRDASDAEYDRLYSEYERAFARYGRAHRRHRKMWDAEQPKLGETLRRLTAERQELQARLELLVEAELQLWLRLPSNQRALRGAVGGTAEARDLKRQILAKQDAYQKAGSRAYRRARVALERAEAAVQRLEDRLRSDAAVARTRVAA